MPHQLENTVRREQLKLLRFEQFLRRIAPIVLATGLTSAGLLQAQSQLATLDVAGSLLAQLESDTRTRDVFAKAESSVAALIPELSASASAGLRQLSLLQIMETVDEAHNAAQEASHRANIRLLGERRRGGAVDGGTPKLSDNVGWLLSKFVDGGTPKVSGNAAWLKSMIDL
ncbi:MAG: hypothetical protein AAB227_10660 [Pseudomonadota bacterium]